MNKKNILKLATILILTFVMVFSPPMKMKKEAEGSALVGSAFAFFGGLTMGGIASIVLPLALIGLGVYLIYDDIKEVTDTVVDVLEDIESTRNRYLTTAVWWAGLKAYDLVSPYTGKTYAQAELETGYADRYEYIATDPITIPREVITEMQSIIKEEIIPDVIIPSEEVTMTTTFGYEYIDNDLQWTNEERGNLLGPILYYLETLSAPKLNVLWLENSVYVYDKGEILWDVYKNHVKGTMEVSGIFHHTGQVGVKIFDTGTPIPPDADYVQENFSTALDAGYDLSAITITTPFPFDEYYTKGLVTKEFIQDYIDFEIEDTIKFTTNIIPHKIDKAREFPTIANMSKAFDITKNLDDHYAVGETVYQTVISLPDAVSDWVISPNEVLEQALYNIDNWANTDELALSVISADIKSKDKGLAKVINIDTEWARDAANLVPIDIDFSEITNAVNNASTNVRDGIDALPGSIGRSIEDVIDQLLTESGTLSESNKDKIMQVMNMIEGKTSLFNYPLQVMIKFFTLLTQIQNVDCIINFPEINFMGKQLYNGTSLNLSEFTRKPEFIEIYSVYRTVVNAYITFMFLSYIVKKSKTFFSPSMS